MRKHLESISERCERLATVDMFSGNYTSQKGAMHYLKNRIACGFYAGNFADSEIPYERFGDRLLGMRDNLPIKMSEFLVTSYESPIIGVDENGEAIYEHPADDRRSQRYKQIMEGIESYIDDYLEYFRKEKGYMLSLEEWIDLADAYLMNCTEKDMDKLSEIVDSENPVSTNADKTMEQLICRYREQGY